MQFSRLLFSSPLPPAVPMILLIFFTASHILRRALSLREPHLYFTSTLHPYPQIKYQYGLWVLLQLIFSGMCCVLHKSWQQEAFFFRPQLLWVAVSPDWQYLLCSQWVGGHSKPPALCLLCLEHWDCSLQPGVREVELNEPSVYLRLCNEETKEQSEI